MAQTKIKGSQIKDITTTQLASGTLDTDLSSVSASDDTLASAKAIATLRASAAVPYGRATFANGSGAYSTNSTSYAYIDSTNAKTTFTVVYGKLVLVDLFIGGLYSNNTGYTVDFNVGLDGTSTTSTSGVVENAAAQWQANWATNGASTVSVYMRFYFTNVSAGSHTFYPIWKVSNATMTGYIGQYARCYINATELYM